MQKNGLFGIFLSFKLVIVLFSTNMPPYVLPSYILSINAVADVPPKT